MQTEIVGAVLVVGAGVAGMQSALDLAEAGFKVYLLERSSSIGGTMPMLDKTFPTNDCSMCTLSPRLVECGRHLNIEILTGSELVSLKGFPGNFRATVRKRPRGVDIEKCLGCGECAAACPQEVGSEFDQGLGKRKAIYKLYPQAFPSAYAIDWGNCLRCLECVEACPTGAISHEEAEEMVELKVGAVILSPGFEFFDPVQRGEFGYGIYTNVFTSLQFERMLSASGPYAGRLVRPSDRITPKRVAFIQCVGSRDPARWREYCSAVCCMYATKQSIIAREHVPGLESTVFFLDLRAFGKNFEQYYEQARQDYGVRYIRCFVSSVKELQQSKDLRLRYRTLDGDLQEEDFDLVVLSLGIKPSAGVGEIAAVTGIELDQYGFCKTLEHAPGCTSRPGIFAAGAFCEPKDIPETVVNAGTAAAHASALLKAARHSLTVASQYPPEIDISDQPPRIGVFVCKCGSNIQGVIDTLHLVAFARTLKNVVYAGDFLFSCSQDSILRIKERIREHGINRLVIASCTPRTHAPLFQNSLREVGLNPYLYEQANIREHSAWVHQQKPEEATAKARDLVAMAVAKAGLLKPVITSVVYVNRHALVVGGGLAGMMAALSLAEQGFSVYLAERSNVLGGNLRKIYSLLEELDPQQLVADLGRRLQEHDRVSIFTGAEVVDVKGYVGNYVTTLQCGNTRFELAHGAVILATGAEPAVPQEYLYNENQCVLTQLELEEKIADLDLDGARNIVMIQCVGSRQEGRPYCSRFCCSQAVKNALKIKEVNPETNIFIFYRDMRTYGFKEKYYLRAREKGVFFIRYEDLHKPKVRDTEKGLVVSFTDLVLGEDFVVRADLLVLGAGVAPGRDNEKLSRLFKVPLNADGFFAEAHMKLRPVDFAAEGIYLCGLAHSPKTAGESIAQAGAAALRAVTLLSKDNLESPPIAATVDEEICSGCGMCVAACQYDARFIDEDKVARVNEALCQGCGACVSACLNGASQQNTFEKKQIMAMLDAAV